MMRPMALLVAVLLGGLVACDDPFRLQAQFPNLDRAIELWALTGSSPTFPSAVVVPTGTASRLDASGTFDFAVDIDRDGRLVVYPVGKIVQPLNGTRQIQLQRSNTPYLQLLEAPKTGWLQDSTLLVNPGGVFLARVPSLACQFGASSEIYAKFSVDSIDPVGRRVVLTTRINPNCGFRSWVTGLPEF